MQHNYFAAPFKRFNRVAINFAVNDKTTSRIIDFITHTIILSILVD